MSHSFFFRVCLSSFLFSSHLPELERLDGHPANGELALGLDMVVVIAGGKAARQTKVGNFNNTVVSHETVARGHVAVYKATACQVIKTRCNVQTHLNLLGKRHVQRLACHAETQKVAEIAMGTVLEKMSKQK